MCPMAGQPAGVGAGVGRVVGAGVGRAVGRGVGRAVGRGVGPAVGRGVGPAVGCAGGAVVGPAVGVDGVDAGMATEPVGRPDEAAGEAVTPVAETSADDADGPMIPAATLPPAAIWANEDGRAGGRPAANETDRPTAMATIATPPTTIGGDASRRRSPIIQSPRARASVDRPPDRPGAPCSEPVADRAPGRQFRPTRRMPP